MPTYDIKSHPLLSKKAKALLQASTQVFDAVTIASERALGLRGLTFTGEDEQDAILAIVYQVNYEMEITPESQMLENYRRGDRSFGYKKEMSATESRAQSIAQRLIDSLKPAKPARQSGSVSVGVEHVW